MVEDTRAPYRTIIDALVEACREGQGQIGPRRARVGIWNANADLAPEDLSDQHAFNVLLRKLDASEREVLAQVLEQQFVAGVHQALAVLHEHEVPPFEDGYEGTPYHDFVGRLAGWAWPIDGG
jgi:hypothetical protein